VVLSETEVAEGTLGNFNFWRTRSGADSDVAVAAEPVPFFPGAGETVFRIFRIPPAGPEATPAQLAEIAERFFGAIGRPEVRTDTSRHPLMHTTPTTDYIMLLSGEASLLLDEGPPIALRPFDAVVQRATNHTWLVTGSEPAVFVGVMVGNS
jgi:hypothetical protein